MATYAASACTWTRRRATIATQIPAGNASDAQARCEE
jgi:hypothetical protein